MQTKKIFTATDPKGIQKAAEILSAGGVVGIPTETVYGLAANALDEAAVKKIFTAKGRPQDNPLIVHIADMDMLPPLITDFPEKAQKAAKAFWPGPFTMILPKSDVIPDAVSAGLSTVAIRMPAHPVANAMIAACRLPIAAPSANVSGRPSPTNAEDVYADLNGKIDAIVYGGESAFGVESTVVTFTCDPPRLLRPGAVTLEQLTALLGEVTVDNAVLAQPEAGKPVASPGMKYKHYAPQAKVVMVSGTKEQYIAYVNAQKASGVYALCFDEDIPGLEVPYVTLGPTAAEATHANRLFSALRELDKLGCTTCYAVTPARTGVSLAVYNRLIRAAAFQVVEL